MGHTKKKIKKNIYLRYSIKKVVHLEWYEFLYRILICDIWAEINKLRASIILPNIFPSQ